MPFSRECYYISTYRLCYKKLLCYLHCISLVVWGIWAKIWTSDTEIFLFCFQVCLHESFELYVVVLMLYDCIVPPCKCRCIRVVLSIDRICYNGLGSLQIPYPTSTNVSSTRSHEIYWCWCYIISRAENKLDYYLPMYRSLPLSHCITWKSKLQIQLLHIWLYWWYYLSSTG